MSTAAPSPDPAAQNAVHPLSEMSPNATPGLSRLGRLAWLLADGDAIELELQDGRRATMPVHEIATQSPDNLPEKAASAALCLRREITLGNASTLGGVTQDEVVLSSTVAYETAPSEMPPYRRAPIGYVEPLTLTSTVTDRVATTSIEDITIVHAGDPARRRPAQLTLIGRHLTATDDTEVMAALFRDGTVGIFPALGGTNDVPEADPIRTLDLDSYRTELDAEVLIATDDTTVAFTQVL